MRKGLVYIFIFLSGLGIGWSYNYFLSSNGEKQYTENAVNEERKADAFAGESIQRAESSKQGKAQGKDQMEGRGLISNRASFDVSVAAANSKSISSVSQSISNEPSRIMSKVDPEAAKITSYPAKFKEEDINYEWALAHEKNLKETLYKAPEFNGKEISGIMCKSAICEIKISVETEEKAKMIGSDLMRLLSSNKQNNFGSDLMITYSELDKSAGYYILGF